jgi:hypothetical protein
MAASVPDAPSSLTMASQSPTAIAISWTTPYNGGTPITTYQIWWDNGQGGLPASFVQKISSTGVVTLVTISSGIVTDTVYQIAIKASNLIGDSSLSSVISIRAAQAPDAPAAPSKVTSTTNSITVQWTSPGFNGGNVITHYSLYIDNGAGGAFSLLVTTADASTTSYLASGLTMGQTYRFKVSAWNQVGQSLLS